MTPTLYEWAGGADALDRLTECFYRRVKADPVLDELFANLPEDHPHHVALWLGEVFGGPKAYTEEHGGYPHMLSKHVGLAIRRSKGRAGYSSSRRPPTRPGCRRTPSSARRSSPT